ncbi:MAG: response regulator, partial [Candidatus Omnitrophica bacterium]|nr:response regulator [Candidatus Omnitrophota bacterium]
NDNKVIVEQISIWLKYNGYKVIAAFGATQALAMANHEKPDLILLDNRMPLVSGLSIIGKLRKLSETAMIPIIVITGSPGSYVSDLALELGAADILGKPFDVKEMLGKIKKALAQN